MTTLADSTAFDIDIIEGVRVREQGGTITEIVRQAIMRNDGIPVSQLTADEFAVIVLDNSSLPQPGDDHPIEPSLKLAERSVRARNPQIMLVDMMYRLPGGGGFDPPPGDTFVLQGTAEVEQVESQVHRIDQPDGTMQGEQVIVEHNGVKQGAEVRAFEFREVIRLGHVRQSFFPRGTGLFYTNTVNTGPFLLDAFAQPRTWHFGPVSYELIDRKTTPFPSYQFTYEIRFNSDGHDPQVVYIDPGTGKPPEGLVQGVGFKTVQWYNAVDFAGLFG